MIFAKKNNKYELLRYCDKINTNVIKSSIKLFNYFIKNYKYNEIVTVIDRSYSNSYLYEKMGFKFDKKTKPNYYYIINGIKYNKFNFKKSKLIKQGYNPMLTENQIMLNRNIYRLYDSGNLIFKYQ